MALTRPQFALPYSLSSDATVELRFTDTTTSSLNLGTPATDLYNNRVGLVTSDLLAWVAAQINTNDGDGTWSWAEVPGNILGRSRLINSARADGKTVDQITFGGSLSGSFLGYSSDVVSVADPTEIDSPYVRGRLYIPHSDSVTPIAMVDDARTEMTIVESVTPSAQMTQDLYGTINMRRIAISPVDAAFIKAHYASNSEYLLTDMTLSDPNAPFDRFCVEWVSLTGDSKKCRYYPELPDISTGLPTYNVLILPKAEWLSNVEVAASVMSEAPLLYEIDIDCYEV